MNKKYLVYSILTASLFGSSVSFSMHSLIFRGVQVISGGYCIGKGFEKAYKRDQLLKDVGSLKDLIIPEYEPIHEFVASEAKGLNIPKKSLYCTSAWGSTTDGLFVPWDFCFHLRLKKKLQQKLDERKSLTWVESRFSDISHRLDDDIRECQDSVNAYEIMSDDSFCLKHEFGHQVNGDSRKRVYAYAASPLAVQAIGSSITYTFNKLRGIGSPQTIDQLLGRSSLAIGTIPLKIALAYCGTSFYNRYGEWRADEYACKNADQKELGAAYNQFQNHYIESNKTILEDPDRALLANAKGIFKNNKSVVGMLSKRLRNGNIRADEDPLLLRIVQFVCDPEHPYSKDRADFIKKHMQKEGKDHPKVKN